jgi:hypothetical protein
LCFTSRLFCWLSAISDSSLLMRHWFRRDLQK